MNLDHVYRLFSSRFQIRGIIDKRIFLTSFESAIEIMEGFRS
jgi:hypothetical protein